MRALDINQLKKTMQLTGTPGSELLAKIKSDEVLYASRYRLGALKHVVNGSWLKLDCIVCRIAVQRVH
jgi:hypothetical protein